MMNWWRRWFGLDPVDFVVHFGIGGFLIGMAAEMSKDDVFSLFTAAAMLAAYAWRRHRAVAALPAVGSTSGEVRVAELEAQAEEIHDLRARMAELEERVDFAERLLAKQADSPQQLGR